MKTALMIAFLCCMAQPYNIELAVTPTEQATGLMYRKEWTSDGMLFVNQKPRQVGFWMKNTYLNMVIIYLDKDFNVLEIHYPKPLSTDSIVSKTDRVQYILELKPELVDPTMKKWDSFKVKLLEQLSQKQTNIKELLMISRQKSF